MKMRIQNKKTYKQGTAAVGYGCCLFIVHSM